MIRKLTIPDKRMLKLMDLLKETGRIRFQQEFLDAIHCPKQSLASIKTGKQHFTVAHIRLACGAYEINANWLLGLDKEIFKAKIIKTKLPKTLPKFAEKEEMHKRTKRRIVAR